MPQRLVVDDRVLDVRVEGAATPVARRRGLLGRDGIDGALVIPRCRQVHTIGMRFAIDVAFVDGRGRVLSTVTMPPNRVSRVVWRSRWVVEARAGALTKWGVRTGVTLDLREHAGHGS